MHALTQHSTRLAGFMVAMGVTVLVQGGMLWKFDDVAQLHAAAERNRSALATVTLARVTISAPRS
ncbi:MAG: hypothetical protein RLZ81_309 [Pseudomonadota bacterium]|jgi:hypothetical protein